jgi:hypothetical protein
MKSIPISEIQDGMVLAKPIFGLDGKILLSPGAEVKSSMADRLKNWGVAVAHIEDDEDHSEEKAERLALLNKTFENRLNHSLMKIIYMAVKRHIEEQD